MKKQGMHNLFQLINALTTNKELNNWGDFFNDDGVALAIVDRIIDTFVCYQR
ncbi:MAG: hypothetical protein KGZ88_14710 [Methylomicrobium sp.]|nr:hypothetical protein [Methylomicrobium sp.]